MPGRAFPAAQPQTEFTTTISVPGVPWTAWLDIRGRPQFLDPEAGQLFSHRRDEKLWIHSGPFLLCTGGWGLGIVD